MERLGRRDWLGMSVIFLGPPGCGKGTQADRLLEEYELGYILSSSFFPESIRSSGKLGDDNYIVNRMAEAIENNTHSHNVIDGFPRTPVQADSLYKIVKTDYVVIKFEVDDNIILNRLSRRLACPTCSTSHTVESIFCKKCSTLLVAREDDRPEKIVKRLVDYRLKTLPVLEHPNIKNKLWCVDANSDEDLVEEQVQDILRSVCVTA